MNDEHVRDLYDHFWESHKSSWLRVRSQSSGADQQTRFYNVSRLCQWLGLYARSDGLPMKPLEPVGIHDRALAHELLVVTFESKTSILFRNKFNLFNNSHLTVLERHVGA